MQKKSFSSKKNEKKINEGITAHELMVVTDTGESLGKMSRDTALNLAQEKELDLVEV